MYGQTNCWTLPEGDYAAFRGLDDEIYIMTERSALNLSYQDRMPETGKPEKLLDLKGSDLLGLPVKSPRTPHEHIYVLPLLTILTNKGTGIVTSVPSDAPDDYAALMDLVNKPKLREKYGIRDEWVLPYQVIPIIDIPGFGTAAAEKVCLDMKIQSQNDTKKLAEAKQLVYLKGFTDGVLVAGEYAGKKVNEVKGLIKSEMIAAGEAVLYSEPEKPVVSRSGDDCVVALTDQWYMTYGEQEWREATESCLRNMELYDDNARHQFEHTLSWLNQWACSRSFGLGTRLPWDPVYLIESLSDSTIYMAYYAVAHVLQEGDMYGEGESPIKPEHMTPEVWPSWHQSSHWGPPLCSCLLLPAVHGRNPHSFPTDGAMLAGAGGCRDPRPHPRTHSHTHIHPIRPSTEGLGLHLSGRPGTRQQPHPGGAAAGKRV
jgi:leucyl-tRNA synthetase